MLCFIVNKAQTVFFPVFTEVVKQNKKSKSRIEIANAS
jgi:hypothetical protein